ncbi:phage major tail tube protein (plasmid) [Pseudomonas sp. B26140]|uniref:phage major tail tube protein n=1 Tax=Pseudomonas sp. B26140 TaxID=3235112 RepID=UPI003782F584
MAMIPQTLFGQNMSIGGVSFQGDVPSFTLPKLKIKTEAARFGGTDGEIDMDQGVEKLECSFTTTGVRKEGLVLFGLADQNAFSATFRGGFKGVGGAVTPVVTTVRGMLTELDPGDWKAGDKAEFKFAASLTYFKLEVAGEVIYEIDILGYKRIINGVDQLAEMAAALGI